MMQQPRQEELIFVDSGGLVTRVSADKTRSADEYTAVVLVLVFMPKQKQVVLFNRGAGASDMRDHWALTAGKMNATDASVETRGLVGKRISLDVAKKAASRELQEELNIKVQPDSLEPVVDFAMPEKSIYFTMLAWPIAEDKFLELSPDGGEVDAMRRFSLADFEANPNLGDAIVYKKEYILDFLTGKFSA